MALLFFKGIEIAFGVNVEKKRNAQTSYTSGRDESEPLLAENVVISKHLSRWQTREWMK